MQSPSKARKHGDLERIKALIDEQPAGVCAWPAYASFRPAYYTPVHHAVWCECLASLKYLAEAEGRAPLI